MPYHPPLPFTEAEAPPKSSILTGGIGLAALAGYVNVVVLGAFAVPVSHMSGAVSRLGIDIATSNSQDLVLIFLIIAGFLAGASVSGAIIGAPQLEPGRRYGIALIAEAAALAAATVLLSRGARAGVPAAALACGIQNGMASSYYGLIIRTTHVTGIVTDLGVLIGQRLRGTGVEAWKPLLLTGLLVGFLLGAVAGQWMVATYGPLALGLPAFAALTSGVAYVVWRSRKASAQG